MSSSGNTNIVFNEQRGSNNSGILNNTHVHSSGHKRSSSREQQPTMHKRPYVAPETNSAPQVRNNFKMLFIVKLEQLRIFS